MTPNLEALCVATGIVWDYLDGAGRPVQAPEETCIALLRALGFAIENDTDIQNHLDRLRNEAKVRYFPETIIAISDEATTVSCSHTNAAEWQIDLEDGARLQGIHRGSTLSLPPLPLGIHSFSCAGQSSVILSAPETLPVPARGWGIMAPLYGLGGKPKKNIGTYFDLQELATSVAPLGPSFIGINPVHAGFTADPLAASPYSPSSRQWLNPLHISVQQLPQWPAISSQFACAGEETEFVNYAIAISESMKQLRAAFSVFQTNGEDSEFAAFVAQEGTPLRDFAIHQALSEVHGPYWSDWPEKLQTPTSPDTLDFIRANEEKILFHCWLQWVARKQVASAQAGAQSAGMEYGLYLDLAVGTHPYGAETWSDEHAFSRDVSIGSPSDAFSASGQNWNLAPFNPIELQRRSYLPLALTLRSQLRFCGLLRIDHILGFERSFWIPEGLPGAYVKFPREAMLAVVRIEAARAGATVIGEDLGNVPDGFRKALSQSGILGCRVAFFERNWKTDKSFIKAKDYEPLSLASITTHDLPTFKGWWKGQDIGWLQKLGLKPDAAINNDLEERNKDRQQIAELIDYNGATSPVSDTEDPDGTLILAAYKFLAKTRSCLAAVQIEDVLELVEQPNLPGTISEHPNWRRRLPVDTSKLAEIPMLKKISEIMTSAHQSGEAIEDQRRI